MGLPDELDERRIRMGITLRDQVLRLYVTPLEPLAFGDLLDTAPPPRDLLAIPDVVASGSPTGSEAINVSLAPGSRSATTAESGELESMTVEDLEELRDSWNLQAAIEFLKGGSEASSECLRLHRLCQDEIDRRSAILVTEPIYECSECEDMAIVGTGYRDEWEFCSCPLGRTARLAYDRMS